MAARSSLAPKRASAVGETNSDTSCSLESTCIEGGKAGKSEWDATEFETLVQQREDLLNQLVELDELHERKPTRENSRMWHQANARLVAVVSKIQDMSPGECESDDDSLGKCVPHNGISRWASEANKHPLGHRKRPADVPPWREGKKGTWKPTDTEHERGIVASCSDRECANRHGHATHVRLGLALRSQGYCKCGQSLTIKLAELLQYPAASKELRAIDKKHKRTL